MITRLAEGPITKETVDTIFAYLDLAQKPNVTSSDLQINFDQIKHLLISWRGIGYWTVRQLGNAAVIIELAPSADSEVIFRCSASNSFYRKFLAQKGSPRPINRVRRALQTHVPVLYAQVLEPTLADLHEEHTLAASPWQARWVLLRGCCALAAAATCQLGYSLLGRIAAIWQARSLK